MTRIVGKREAFLFAFFFFESWVGRSGEGASNGRKTSDPNLLFTLQHMLPTPTFTMFREKMTMAVTSFLTRPR